MDLLWGEIRGRTLKGRVKKRGDAEEVMPGEPASLLESPVIRLDHSRPSMVSTGRHGEKPLVAYPYLPRPDGDMDPRLCHEFGSYDLLCWTFRPYDLHVNGGRQGRRAHCCGRRLHESPRRL